MDLFKLFPQDQVILLVLISLRTCGAMAVGPLASWRGIPANLRVILGIGLGLALLGNVPTAGPSAVLHPTIFDLARELGIGLIFGVASSLVVSALQLAAGLVDFQAGFTFGASVDPLSGLQAGPLEHFLTAFSTVLFLDLNGHQLFVAALADLFRVIPVGASPALVGPTSVARFFTTIFVAALVMALPVVTMLLLVDVGLALLGRTAPQFNLFAVGLPLRAILSVVALLAVLPIIATQLGQVFALIPRILPLLASK